MWIRRSHQLLLSLLLAIFHIHYCQKHEESQISPNDLSDKSEKDFLHPSDRIARERIVLIKFFASVGGTEVMKLEGKWFEEEHQDHCSWEGVTCRSVAEGSSAESCASKAISRIDLADQKLSGVLPTELALLEHLTRLDLSNNDLHGTIPEHFVHLTNLERLNLDHNQLSGTIPSRLGNTPTSLRGLWLSDNYLTGSLPTVLSAWKGLVCLDVSENGLTGTVPAQIGLLSNLQHLIIADNLLSGSLPDALRHLSKLRILDAGTNLFHGPLPARLNELSLLQNLNLADNIFAGPIPTHAIGSPRLEILMLSDNVLTGTIPVESGIIQNLWSSMKRLGTIKLDYNKLNGTIPGGLFLGLKDTLSTIDLSYNDFSGTIATELGEMTMLNTIDAMSNQLHGTLPTEMLKMSMNLFLNFTDNFLTGQIPKMFCGEGALTMNMLYRQFGCDAVLCRAGTFSIYGHATLHSGCRPCPPNEQGENENPSVSTILGRTSCPGVDFVLGDLNGDGELSEREVLRMIYVDTIGTYWGEAFLPWADMRIDACDLAGITCVNGKVAKIDLTNANLCSNGDRSAGPILYCIGLPAEIGYLSHLEILQVSRRQFLRGTIPSEFGMLSKLRFLDVSSSSITGTIPTELGMLTNLKILVLSHCKLTGIVPTELYKLSTLEKLHLTNNDLSGSIPASIHFENVRELMISRNELNGTIPTEIGFLLKMENFEAYGNKLSGSIPTAIGLCTNLKRVDIFNNALTGPLPEELGNLTGLQIFHCKQNNLSGTIPQGIGELKLLSWIDASQNKLHGTIPSSFGASRTLIDLRVGDNMLYDPLPRGLCSNPNINSGMTKKYGCDGILCALGSYSEMGYAMDKYSGCQKCPDGQSTLYLGSTECRTFTPRDILSIFYSVMNGGAWSEEHRRNWQDSELDVCEWSGVTCDATGEIVSLAFPFAETDNVMY